MSRCAAAFFLHLFGRNSKTNALFSYTMIAHEMEMCIVCSDLIALQCKECRIHNSGCFFSLFQMYRAHQSVQINAIMVHVIHAIARRYARSYTHAHAHTNKHTIKRINSHCQIHTCSCGLAELKWLYFISLLLSRRVKLFVVVVVVFFFFHFLFAFAIACCKSLLPPLFIFIHCVCIYA